MEKYGFVYIWRDKKYNKYYVGSHWGHKDDRYICSSQNMRVNKKHRPNDFKREILAYVYTNRQNLLKEEQRWLDMIKPEEFGHKYYNINAKVNMYFWWMNEDTKKLVVDKMANSLREKFKNDPEYRIKVGNARRGLPSPMKGKHHTDETKQTIKEKRAKQIFTQETKQKMSEAQLTRDPVSIECREKMSKSMQGNKNGCGKRAPRSEEWKAKLRGKRNLPNNYPATRKSRLEIA